ncbi:hypothetical protein [Sulfurospirillum diekertiae]|uniref:Uncharacterized protein n=1 Tax=Sulfurospirillum diekertiae TaxID=1854492 RepID=A0A1Y0HJN5_9BACT|nr:hypothetical protein [Sulfurospirillum diekertiae]ARU48311.1 hypothetical protein Sdiek1_1145 [Sulfurospirillum diekertiae]ASC93150.1 hypothetical protein Sdiek2_1129 [Sulfurospirillum diekertiae]
MSLQKFNIQDYEFLYSSDNADRLIGIDVFNSMFLPDSYFFYEGMKIYQRSSDTKIALFSGFFGDYPYVYFSYFPIQSSYFLFFCLW